MHIRGDDPWSVCLSSVLGLKCCVSLCVTYSHLQILSLEGQPRLIFEVTFRSYEMYLRPVHLASVMGG